MSARPAYYYRNQQYFVCWSRNSAELGRDLAATIRVTGFSTDGSFNAARGHKRTDSNQTKLDNDNLQANGSRHSPRLQTDTWGEQ